MDVGTSIIHVCPMRSVPAMLERTGARHLITVVNEQMMLATPVHLDKDNHLRLGCNDIIAPQTGMVCPGPEHVDALIGFVKRWDHDGPLLIHCLAGISRSPAAAFIALCTLNPEAPEPALAARLRQASRTATPNRRMVELADDALGRRGRMVDAVEQMGIGSIDAAEAIPFGIDSRHW
jgi:predicted protein tyrosine phosphatase